MNGLIVAVGLYYRLASTAKSKKKHLRETKRKQELFRPY